MEEFTKNNTRKTIVDAARILFWKHGIRRVTIEEICREASISKMTFYRYFTDKIELAKTVLDQFYDESIRNFRLIMNSDYPVSEKMKKLIQMKLNGSNDISSEFIQDFLINTNLGLKNYMEEKLKFIWTETINEFKRGQERGWIRKDLNVEFMFHFSQKIIPVLNDDDLLKLFSSPSELINEMTRLFVYGIAPIE